MRKFWLAASLILLGLASSCQQPAKACDTSPSVFLYQQRQVQIFAVPQATCGGSAVTVQTRRMGPIRRLIRAPFVFVFGN